MLKMALISHNSNAHQTWRSGLLLRLGFNEVANFLSKDGGIFNIDVFYFRHMPQV
jgi:hypothetical protein